MAIAVATILNPLLRWRWIDSSRFDQKRLIRKHALGHRTTVLANEIEPESIRFGEETRIKSEPNCDIYVLYHFHSVLTSSLIAITSGKNNLGEIENGIQVHITQGDHEGRSMIISWVTPVEKYPNVVTYWEASTKHLHKLHTHSEITTYRYYNYASGYIHHATIKDLTFDTKYFYEVASNEVTHQFSFTTPPKPGPDVSYTFGVIGDLGQTADSNRTLEHYMSNPIKSQAVLFAGDLSYADDHPNHDNTKWDTFGRFIEKSVAYQPWIWSAGNHEIDLASNLEETNPFKPYLHRYYVPYKASQSTSPFWYSIKRASTYIIVLSSYSAYGKYTPQYKWLEQELPKINRYETPWVVVILHAPWYNTNHYHYMEGESMRVQFESLFVQYKVDIVFASHVHSYERLERISNIKYNIINGLSLPVRDINAPAYITIGDGGNMEGIANKPGCLIVS
ncbi:hypothetical protein TEA_022861 [Camellia sinensis var. sinensis]|uniref:Purple acid phosphatase n=1 Tax=Camellia sinensis var. sinensis TaxID=542762 RepID=A0A4S4E8L0_CAMSN|nr:hypothetical protein TEA_022861 [Camellia sinensis var. sinensis]